MSSHGPGAYLYGDYRSLQQAVRLAERAIHWRMSERASLEPNTRRFLERVGMHKRFCLKPAGQVHPPPQTTK